MSSRVGADFAAFDASVAHVYEALGEPVTATLGLVPLLLVAIQKHGFRRGFLTSFGIGAVGLLIALPQIVAPTLVVATDDRYVLWLSAQDDVIVDIGRPQMPCTSLRVIAILTLAEPL